MMKLSTLWDQPYGTLLAGATPWSVEAYEWGKVASEASIVHCDMAAARAGDLEQSRFPQPTNGKQTASPAQSSGPQEKRKSIIERIEAWSWRREMRKRDAYLAQAQDLLDLEDRMRRFDRDMVSRGRALC